MLIQLPNAFGDAATNMAIDATLLETIPEGLAIFRHYGWLEPAATFGYAQPHATVASELASGSNASPPPHTAVVRRMTGGGIVDHRNDWTYALILHRSLPCTGQPATQLYKKIHQAISHALTAMGIDNQLAPCPKNCQSTNLASHCFRSPAADDVLRPDGQKIAGAAMKRSHQSLLIQGSIDRATLPNIFDFADFQTRLHERIDQALHLETGELEDIRPLFDNTLIQREKERFACPAWNQRR